MATSNTAIKITALPNIGNAIAPNTLIPVVNIAGVPITQKANLQITGNLILAGAGGANFVPAGLANLAYSVVNAAQPNITSVGTLTGLTISNFSNLHIPGGTNGYFLQTDGTGNLSWSAVSGGNGGGTPGGSNSQIQYNLNGSFAGSPKLNWLESNSTLRSTNFYTPGNITVAGNTISNAVYTDNYFYANGDPFGFNSGNIGFTGDAIYDLNGIIIENNDLSHGATSSLIIPSNGNTTVPIQVNNTYGNVKIQTGPSGAITKTWNFDKTGNLNTPGNLVGPSSANFVIFANAGVHNFTFGDDGTFYAPDNVVLGGTSISIGPGANTLSGLANAVLVASSNSEAFIQGVINNVSDIGSADWVAEGHHGDDDGGWVDMGFTSSGFGDPNYTITGQGDGYVFAQSYYLGQAPGGRGGNLVLATGENGTVNDIVFATGGFLAANEFARIEDANNTLHLTKDGSSITFFDGSVQTTAYTGSGGNTFSSITMTDGPAGAANTIQYGLGNIVVWNDGGWTIGEWNGTQYGTEGMRINPGIEGSVDIVLPSDANASTTPVQINNYAGNVQIQTGNGVTYYNWLFDNTGNLKLPNNGGNIEASITTVYDALQIRSNTGTELDYYDSADENHFSYFSIDGTGAYLAQRSNNAGIVSTVNWTFDPSGNLTLPGGGSIYSEGFTPSGAPGNTITLQPAGSGITTNQKLLVYPTAGDGDHIHMVTGNLWQTELFLGSDNFYARLANTGNFVVQTNDNVGNTAYFEFGYDGTLTVPGNIVGSGASPAPSINGFDSISAVYLAGDGSNISNIQVGNVSGLGNIATANLDGNASNVLYGNGVFAAAGGGGGSYGDINVATFLASYGSNTITTTGNVSVGNIIGNGQALTGIAGANVTGTVANANLTQYVNVQVANSSFTGYRVALVDWLAGGHRIEADGNLFFNANTHTIITDNVQANSNVSANAIILKNSDSFNQILFSNDGGTTDNGHIKVDGGKNMVIVANSNFYVKQSSSDRLSITDTNSILSAASNVLIKSNGTTNTWNFDTTGNLTLPANSIAINYNNGTAVFGNIVSVNLTGSTSNILYGNGVFAPATSTYGNSNVVSLLSSFGSNSIFTTGNVNAGNVTANTLVMYGGNAGITTTNGSAVSFPGTRVNVSGNLVITGNVSASNLGNVSALNLDGNASNILYGNGVFASVPSIASSIANGNSNVTIATAAGSVITNVNGAQAMTVSTSGVQIQGTGRLLSPGGAASITLDNNGFSAPQANLSSKLNLTGNANISGVSATGIGAINAGNYTAQLANTIASFTTNVNSYTQVTNQNKSTGTDATSDYILTADNGSDTVNYGDFGIINSGYDNSTPTNSLGNIVYAADTYVYAQGNTSNASQSGGNLAIGTTVPGKNVKIFAGGVDNTAIVANIGNTGVAVTGNISATGNITGNYIIGNGSALTGVTVNVAGNIVGTSSNVTLVAGSYSYLFDNTGNFTMPTNSDLVFSGNTTLSSVSGSNGNITVNPDGTGQFIVTNITPAQFGNTVSINGNLTANSNITANGNISGSQLTSSASAGDEGGQINLAIPQTNTSLANVVTVDVYQNKFRIFEGSANAKGVFVNLNTAPNGVGGELLFKSSGYVNAGTFVTLDIIKATLTSSGNRGLSLATTTGSITATLAATYAVSGGAGGSSSNGNITVTTSASTSHFGWNFAGAGDLSTYVLNDLTNSRCYRITLVIGGGYSNNFISIERL